MRIVHSEPGTPGIPTDEWRLAQVIAEAERVALRFRKKTGVDTDWPAMSVEQIEDWVDKWETKSTKATPHEWVGGPSEVAARFASIPPADLAAIVESVVGDPEVQRQIDERTKPYREITISAEDLLRTIRSWDKDPLDAIEDPPGDPGDWFTSPSEKPPEFTG